MMNQPETHLDNFMTEEDLINKLFSARDLPSIDEISQLLRIVYRNICGDIAYKTFEHITLERLKLLYSMDPKKFGVKGADIIKEAGKQTAGNLEQFMQEVISQDDIDFLSENRPRILQSLIEQASHGIATGTVQSKYRYISGTPFSNNIAGLIIHGSYAYGSFDRESDLDVLYVTRDGSDRLTSYFSDQLSRMSFFNPDIEEIDSPIKPKRLKGVRKFIVVTPFDDVRSKLIR